MKETNNYWKFKINNEEDYFMGQTLPWLSIPYRLQRDMRLEKKYGINYSYEDIDDILRLRELLINYNKKIDSFKETECPIKLKRF